MTVESSIQTNSLPWQVRQAGKNLSEWIQLQLSSGEQETSSTPPDFELPVWISEALIGLFAIGAIIWVSWLIVQAIERYLENRQGNRPSQPVVQLTPELANQSVKEWLKQARQFEQERNWREACRALYMAALQILHDRDWISHQVSRTDGEYLREIQTLKQPRPVQLLVNTHERSLFGGDTLTAENLKRCRTAYEEIEKR
ncbi:DUF4129 domain-containing protein [Oscillatoria sp. CS-180]|uniref:DUF4129 domain-containing protein n=1 Tax=Oscillatoria sp. CS-180 TaxID=3021720 RepID=UPI00232FCC71|nr:DUF4129 domain-containing protein [Oscillatoria sp. CS-180]MDB9528889.1 DUF4129 domain-containing protein [Oscillatoria sp. CS-180]